MENARKRLTTEQWKTVENWPPVCTPTHQCWSMDTGLTYSSPRTAHTKNVIFVYVNGKIDWGKLSEECEECRRFFRPVTKNLLPAKPPKSWKPKDWQRRRQETAFTVY